MFSNTKRIAQILHFELQGSYWISVNKFPGMSLTVWFFKIPSHFPDRKIDFKIPSHFQVFRDSGNPWIKQFGQIFPEWLSSQVSDRVSYLNLQWDDNGGRVCRTMGKSVTPISGPISVSPFRICHFTFLHTTNHRQRGSIPCSCALVQFNSLVYTVHYAGSSINQLTFHS